MRTLAREPGLRRAVDHATKGLHKEPGFLPFIEIRGQYRIRAGLLEMQEGRNPTAWFTPAITDFSDALALDPGILRFRRFRAQARSCLGRYRSWMGEDPSNLLAEAVADLDEVLKIDPGNPKTWMARRACARTGPSIL